jgi:hypothetical protein
MTRLLRSAAVVVLYALGWRVASIRAGAISGFSKQENKIMDFGFPKTLAAVRAGEVAIWAIGDALLIETGDGKHTIGGRRSGQGKAVRSLK